MRENEWFLNLKGKWRYDSFFLLPAIMNMTVFSLKSYGPLGELIWKQCLLLPTKPTKFCAQTDLERDNTWNSFKKILPKSCCYQLTCNKWLHWKVPPIFERKFLSACPINEHRNRSHKTTILYRQSKSGPTFLHLSEGRLRYLDGLQLPGLTRSNWVCHTIQQNLLKKPINN